MSSSFAHATITGVKEVSCDPMISQFIQQLASLIGCWLVQQGHVIEVVELHGDYMLNGNLGKQLVFFQLKNPTTGIPIRLVGEIRAFAKEDLLFAILQIRRNSNGPNPWKFVNSDQVQVHYPSHPGEYKLQLLANRLRGLLNMHVQSKHIEDTGVLQLVTAAMLDD